MFSLARELGVSVSEILKWSSLEIGLWKAFAALEVKEALEANQNSALRREVDRGLADIKDKLKHGYSR